MVSEEDLPGHLEAENKEKTQEETIKQTRALLKKDFQLINRL